MVLFLALLVLGPRETLAGKYVVHSPEYLELYPPEPVPLPDPLPADVDALCRLVEAGHGTPEVYAALGEALLARGEGELAYRAFHRAQAGRGDEAWRNLMGDRKDGCPHVSLGTIAEEERLARYWVERLQDHERERIRLGLDPRDLRSFYERYGRAEDDLRSHVRRRRISWAAGAAAPLLALAAFLGLWLRRRA